MHTTRYTLLTLVISILPGILSNLYSQQHNDFDYSAENTFTIQSPLEVNLEFNMKDFIKNKEKDEFSPAILSYYLPDSSFIRKSVNISPRGDYRRNKCYLPPIKIEFKDSDYRVKEFDQMGKVKLVSLCKIAGNFEQYLIKEYLAYKAYELVSAYSLHTYLMKINFHDSEGKRKPFSSYAFIIEDIDDMAESHDAIEVENSGLLPVHLDRPAMNKLGIFQYMIGNTDWHVPNLHNLKLIKIKDPDYPRPIPVPYDFDYSGIVNANYAIPHESLPITHITERYYMGNCMSDSEFEVVKASFIAQKEEIISLFSDCTVLQPFHRKSSVRYLEIFFEIISNEKSAKNMIFNNCK